MTSRKKYLLATIVLTLLFFVFVVAGSLLFSWGYRAMALLCILPAIISMGGQMYCVLMLARRPDTSLTTTEPRS